MDRNWDFVRRTYIYFANDSKSDMQLLPDGREN